MSISNSSFSSGTRRCDSFRQRREWYAFVFSLLAALGGTSWAAEAPDDEAARVHPPAAQLVRVPLPITGDVDRRVLASIEEILTRWESADAGPSRPILVLEFRGGDGSGSGSSQFERALSMARFLSGGRLARVRTVAYLTGVIQGHAVLPVLGCEEIVADPDAQLGRAGQSESFIDDTMRSAYREMAQRRRTLPVPVVMAMLDGGLTLYKVQTLDGARYALEDELEALKDETAASEVERLVPQGEMAQFSGTRLRLEFGFASHLARDRAQLAAALQLPLGSLLEDPTLGQGRRPIRMNVVGAIHADNVTWLERSLRDEIEERNANFICVVIDSPGGSPQDSLRLASYLSSLDPGRVRTIAYVPKEARSDAALIALACDELVMSDQAVLGGPGARRIASRNLQDIQVAVKQIAQAEQRSWSLMMAMVDQDVTIRSYRQEGTNITRYFSVEEVVEQERPERWVAEGELPTRKGLRGHQALDAGLAVALAEDFAALANTYQLEQKLPSVTPNWAHRLIEFLASPQIAGGLLFIGWFALMFEFMSPGIGVPGFIAAVCFVMFFWSNVLHGTAGWLEILLFVTGVLCVVMEIFVIPGFGAFGIGGALLIVTAIVLASQTFVLPRNAYEWSQVPSSLLVVAAAGAGIIASLVCMRHVLTQAPVFRRVSLEAMDEERLEQIRYQEAMVHFDHLLGKRGTATTPLLPSGKARFGDETVDVISDGEVIAAGEDVGVVEVRGNEILVRAIT